MTDEQFSQLMAALARIENALHGRREGVRSVQCDVPMDAAEAREVMMDAHAGTLVTLDQARATLNLPTESPQAISRLLLACGFERRRGAAGVRFSIAAPAAKVGRRLIMPDIPDGAIESSRKRQQKLKARVFLNLCLQQTGQLMRITRWHVEELHRRYPGVFEA